MGKIEKILPTDRQIQRGIGFFSISSVKVLFPTCVILKIDSDDELKFCTTLMEKTDGKIGILNSDKISDQFFKSV